MYNNCLPPLARLGTSSHGVMDAVTEVTSDSHQHYYIVTENAQLELTAHGSLDTNLKNLRLLRPSSFASLDRAR